jgi:hypothetical protein
VLKEPAKLTSWELIKLLQLLTQCAEKKQPPP